MNIPLYELLAEQPIDLPVFNSIALELLHQLSEHDINYFRVIKTIKMDEALSMQVLKMANSPSYIGLTKCETIETAAIRLGTQQIANLAIAAAHSSQHASDNLMINEVMQYLWQHSYACALGCRSIAATSGHQRLADHAYMAGLLHDIGKLFLIKALEQIQNNMLGFTFDRGNVHGLFSDLHVEFGCRVMDAWNIPEIYRNIVAEHHADTLDEDDFLLAIVRLVNTSSRAFKVSLFPTENTLDERDQSSQMFKLEDINLSKLESVMKGWA